MPLLRGLIGIYADRMTRVDGASAKMERDPYLGIRVRCRRGIGVREVIVPDMRLRGNRLVIPVQDSHAHVREVEVAVLSGRPREANRI